MAPLLLLAAAVVVASFLGGMALRGVLEGPRRLAEVAPPATDPEPDPSLREQELHNAYEQAEARAHAAEWACQQLERSQRVVEAECERQKDRADALARSLRKANLVIQSLESVNAKLRGGELPQNHPLAGPLGAQAWRLERKLASVERRLAAQSKLTESLDHQLGSAHRKLAEEAAGRRSAEIRAQEALDEVARWRESLDRVARERTPKAKPEPIRLTSIEHLHLELPRLTRSANGTNGTASNNDSPVYLLAQELGYLTRGRTGETAVLADPQGVLVAGVGDPNDQHVLAAVSSLAAHFAELIQDNIELATIASVQVDDIDGKVLRIRTFQWSGQSIGLASLGYAPPQPPHGEQVLVSRIVGLLDAGA